MFIPMINKRAFEIYRLFAIKQNSIFLLLCLILAGCSYTPHHYSFSLLESQNETMSFVDSDVEFRFVPSSENIQVSIKNKTDHGITIVRDIAEYLDPLGKSFKVHYGYDYVEEVLNFKIEDRRSVDPLRIKPGTEITGYVWINNCPNFLIGRGTVLISTYNIINDMTPLLPRYSFEGSVKELKGLTFNLILPIDFGEYVRDYTFTFMIDDVIEGRKN
jgi:hypothetical protein